MVKSSVKLNMCTGKYTCPPSDLDGMMYNIDNVKNDVL